MYNWYEEQTQFLKRRFGKRWRLMAALLAATSPRVRLKTSWNWSLTILEAVVEGREPNLYMLKSCHRANVKRALSGEPLSGEKVKRFYANLTGDLEPVTIDTWMVKWFGVDCGSHGSPWPALYRRLETSFQKWAKSKGMKPAVLQAIIWNKIREDNGHKPVGFARIEETSIPF